MDVKKTSHSVYNLNYHIVLVIKYRQNILIGEVEEFVKEQINSICQRYNWEVLALEVMPDHIHVFLSAEPKYAPLTIGTTLKSILAVEVFRRFSDLKARRFWVSGLFTDGTYYGSAGSVSTEIIKKYIEEQKDK